MAIVKVSYTKSRKGIKASVRYIQHRPGQEGERMSRSLFGRDGPISRDEVYNLIDTAVKGTTFFRLILSPDPRQEDRDRDLNLRGLTEQVLLQLSEALQQDIEWLGAIHADHAPHRHVHVIALIQGKLTRDHFRILRETATRVGLFQRRERDLARGITQVRPSRQPSKAGGLGPPLRRPFVPLGGGPLHRPHRCRVCGMENCLVHDKLELEQEI